jgi:hypothetical protein
MSELQRLATELDTQSRNHAADAAKCDRLVEQAVLWRSQYDAWRHGQPMNLPCDMNGVPREPGWYDDSNVGAWSYLQRPADAGPTMLAACERRIKARAALGAGADDHRRDAERCASEAVEIRRQAEALHATKMQPLSVDLG